MEIKLDPVFFPNQVNGKKKKNRMVLIKYYVNSTMHLKSSFHTKDPVV